MAREVPRKSVYCLGLTPFPFFLGFLLGMISFGLLCIMKCMKVSREMTEHDENGMAPPPSLLDDVVRRIVESVQPLKIIVFGSAARGDMGPDSDLDILIVMPEGSHRRQTALLAYRALRGLGIPKDVVVVTERDIVEHGDNPSLIIKPALDEGRAIYGA